MQACSQVPGMAGSRHNACRRLPVDKGWRQAWFSGQIV